MNSILNSDKKAADNHDIYNPKNISIVCTYNQDGNMKYEIAILSQECYKYLITSEIEYDEYIGNTPDGCKQYHTTLLELLQNAGLASETYMRLWYSSGSRDSVIQLLNLDIEPRLLDEIMKKYSTSYVNDEYHECLKQLYLLESYLNKNNFSQQMSTIARAHQFLIK